MQYSNKGSPTKAMREEFEKAQQRERDELEKSKLKELESDDGYG